MAKVPSPPSGISPALGPTVFQNLQSSPDAFGAAQGRALQSAGTAAQQFGNQIFKEQLKKANDRLERRSKQRQIELLEFSRQQQVKWKSLQGEDAVEADENFRVEFRNKITEMADQLENKQEIDDFAILAPIIQTREFEKMDNHVIQQERVASEATDKALIDAQINSIGDDPLNPDFVFSQLDAIGDIVVSNLDKKGISDPAVIADQIVQQKGRAIALATKRLYTRNAELGQSYYDMLKNQPDLMTPQQRIDIEVGLNTAFRAERAELTAMQTLQKAQDKQLREDTADKFLQSILTTTDPNELSSIRQEIIVDEILRPFGVGSKDTLIKLMEADPEGESAVELDVFKRLYLPASDPRHLNRDDILILAPKLGAKATRRLLDDWKKSQTPLGKAEKAFLDQFESVITRSSLIGKDPVGDVNFGRFKLDVDRAIEAAEAEGIDPLTLFDNTHANFARIKNLWQNYKRTVPEITASKMGELQGVPQIETGGTGAVPIPDTKEDKELLIRDGESFQDYLIRRRGKR